MCHGVWERGRWWTGWFAPLAERFCPVAIDVPGYGDSPARARDTLSDWAAVLIEVMDELGAERAYLAGSATGGAACLAAAHEHPDRIAAVVACNTPFNGANLSETVGRFDQLYRREGQQGLVDYMLPLLGLEGASADLADDVRRTYERCDMDVVLRDAGIWGRTDLTRDLPEIGCPVLILAPGASPLISPNRASSSQGCCRTRSWSSSSRAARTSPTPSRRSAQGRRGGSWSTRRPRPARPRTRRAPSAPRRPSGTPPSRRARRSRSPPAAAPPGSPPWCSRCARRRARGCSARASCPAR